MWTMLFNKAFMPGQEPDSKSYKSPKCNTKSHIP